MKPTSLQLSHPIVAYIISIGLFVLLALFALDSLAFVSCSVRICARLVLSTKSAKSATKTNLRIEAE